MRVIVFLTLVGWVVGCGGTVVTKSNQRNTSDGGEGRAGGPGANTGGAVNVGGAPVTSAGGAGNVGNAPVTNAGGAGNAPATSAGGARPIGTPATGGVVGTGGRADAGTGECEVTTYIQEGNTYQSYRFDYDPAARRLVTDVYTIDLDEALRSWKVYGNDPSGLVLYHTTLYDAHGNLASSNHYTLGLRSYANVYDGDLLRSVDATSGGLPDTRTTYLYEDPNAPALWTREEMHFVSDARRDTVNDRTIVDGRVATVTRSSATGTATKKWTYFYEAGRIASLERDGGFWDSDVPDGTPNIRWTWERDASGTVTRYSQDGTDSYDNPYIDGQTDYAYSYSPGCRSLLEQFPWVAHEPGFDSTGPRTFDR